MKTNGALLAPLPRTARALRALLAATSTLPLVAQERSEADHLLLRGVSLPASEGLGILRQPRATLGRDRIVR